MHAPPNVFEPLREGDPERLGGYRPRARLGSGGMGEVFLAFGDSASNDAVFHGPGRPVAVKVVRREFADDPHFRARFAHEIRAARRVGGPRVAPLLDADPDAAQPWLATAYIAGPTLADAVHLYGPLPVASVIVLISAIAEALETIHAAEIVHRDLKPANVVLGADGLRVIDFGIARAADATALTLTGRLLGSPQYVAPEQVLGEAPTPPGDVFALGALAHFAATGRAAFGEGPEVGVVYRVVHAPPDLAGCPTQLRALIGRCLAKDPADRPTTAEIAELCQPDEAPRSAADWLPPAVVFAIDSYGQALAAIAADDETGPGDQRAAPRAVAPADEPDSDLVELSGEVGPPPPGSRRPRARRFFLGLAAGLAVAGAGAGIALGITSANPTGTIGVLQAGSSRTPSQSTNTYPDRPPPPPPGPGGGGAPGQPPPVAAPTSVIWTGTFRITETGVWLDGQPPIPAEGGVSGDVREAAPAPTAELSSNNSGITNLALWGGSGTPTGTQCQQLAFAHGVWELHAKTGDIVCALTAHRHVAVLRIVTFPSDDSGVTATETLWGGAAN